MTVEESIRRTTAEPSHTGGTKKTFFRFLIALAVLGALVYVFRDVRVLFDDNTRTYREKIFYDPANGLMWYKLRTDPMRQDDADAYCRDLHIGDMEGWRLPTLSELRTIVKGCSYTEDGGLCPARDGCLMRECRDENCACGEGNGPGEDKLYWEKDAWEYIPGHSQGYYWSSSKVQDAPGGTAIWMLSFVTGAIDPGDPTMGGHIRCVSGPLPMRERLKQYLIFRK